MKEIEFWFSIGSTYTYLSVTRLKEVEQKYEVKFSWQPFSVRKIMLEMDNVPFPPTKKVKTDYMWRDIERRANSYGFEAKVPTPYPLKEFNLANKIAVIGMQEGWCSDYVIVTYRRWFVAGLEPGSEPNVSESLREIDQDPERALELAADDNIHKAYLSQTEHAQSKNIFGSLSFIVDGEQFLGDVRLEDAVNWALR